MIHTAMDVAKGIGRLAQMLDDRDKRIEELEAKVERLTTALLETPCSCIGLRPCREEGTKCSRCVALEGE